MRLPAVTFQTASDLCSRWRAEADTLRRRGAESEAIALASCAADLEAWAAEHETETLTLAEAATVSGYSYSALEKMVRAGRLANAGWERRPRVRVADLPRKAKPATATGPTLAERILRSG